MFRYIQLARLCLVFLGLGICFAYPVGVGSQPAQARSLVDAICPVVYQLDDSPGTRGYHYIFYGNAFFINREGYLLTAAHVLADIPDGGQPSVLLRLASAPPRLVKVKIVDIDVEHDIAILRATPNPFLGPYLVTALTLAPEKPSIGLDVEATALRPSRSRDPHTFELPVGDSYPATVVGYRLIDLDPNAKLASASANVSDRRMLTSLFLFSHEVQRGQSGAPVVNVQTGQVVGLIEGRWLHPVTTSLSQRGASATELTQGAGVPIPYAVTLLQKNHVMGWSTREAGE
jgi:S1-C subfamily serine protease